MRVMLPEDGRLREATPWYAACALACPSWLLSLLRTHCSALTLGHIDLPLKEEL